MSSDSHIVIQPAYFDRACLRITPHQSSSFTKGNNKLTNIKSDIQYRAGPPGSETYKKLYIVAPSQQVFGFSEQYDMGKPESLETFKGYQVGYPMSATINPTAEEKAFFDVVNYIYEAVIEAGKIEVENHKALIRAKQTSTFYGNAVGSYTQAVEMNDMTMFIKPVLTQPLVANSKPPTEDKTKPPRMYMSLVGRKSKDTGAYVLQTQIFGPGNKKLNIADHVSKMEPKVVRRGRITPLVEFSHVYWGSHNSKPFAGSIKIFVAQCNYVPASTSTVPTQSLLPPVSGDGGDFTETADNAEFDNAEGEDCFSKPSTTDLASELAKHRRVPAPVETLERPAPDVVVPTPSVPEVPKVTRTRKVVAKPAAETTA